MAPPDPKAPGAGYHRIHIELDVTPAFWNTPVGIGAAIAALVTSYNIGEIKATRTKLLVLLSLPREDTLVPQMLDELRLAMRACANEAIRAAETPAGPTDGSG